MYDNKKRILSILIFAAVIFSLFTIYIYSSDQPRLSARSAVLYEPETNTFLFKQNEDEHLAMASTTKIMTALLALENLDLDALVEIPGDAVAIEGSSLYLEEGEILSVNDLLYGLILQSANDAAVALAIEISGSTEAFAALMNERAIDLGLSDTNFKNPHGLDDTEHYTTAHDLAIISAEALKNEKFKEISSSYKKEIESSHKTRVVINHNKLLKSYDGCIGVKTGYTKKSGRSLVSAAERDGLTLIAVTINAPDDWSDHTILLDYGYSLLEKVCLAYPMQYSFDIPVLEGDSDTVTVSSKDAIYKIFNKSNSDYDVNINLSRYLVAPIEKDDILGTVVFSKEGKEIGKINLTADKTINKKSKKAFPFFNKG